MQREQIWFYYCTPKKFLAKQINITIRKSSSRAFQHYFFSFKTDVVIEIIGFQFSPISLLGTIRVPTKGQAQWPCKNSNLYRAIALTASFWCKKWTGLFGKARSGLFISIFFPSALLWPLRTLDLKFSLHIPTGYYIRRLLASIGHAAGIQILGIPTAKIQISNGRHTCYRYPAELKPSAKWPHRYRLLIL